MNNLIEARRAFYDGRPREVRVRSFEVRSDADGKVGLRGYASVTDTPYQVTDWLGEYTESIARGSFAKALAERDDVRLLFNHDGIPMARTKSGTMTLEEDDHGLLVGVDELDGDSPLVQSVRSAMARGDLDEMSFAFKATRQEWNEDYTVRTIREVRLYDVSVVTYPASGATSVQLNSKEQQLDRIMRNLREGRALDAPDLNMLTQALGWLASIDNIVDAGQAQLSEYMGVDNPDVDENAAKPAAERRLALAKARAAAAAL